MYRHVLVPLDDSPLSVEVVFQAVKLASALGARVTFFHAKTDYGTSSLAALERVLAPAAFNEHVAGEARAIIAKAETVARAANVAFDSIIVASDRPYEAIVEAAETCRCDLIVIASHGRRGLKGLMLGSQTQKVLQHTTIPVLVATVESNLADADKRVPLAIIRDEHRSMAAVLHGLEYLVREARETKKAPSFPLLRAMLHYVKAFPEALHHPKEEAYLFRKLRARTHDVDPTLNELARQHVEGHAYVVDLEKAITAYEADRAHGLPRFAKAVARFASAEMQHMLLETKVILPAARQYLTEEDWAEIDEAFSGNNDPRFSVDNDEEFRQLFARIQNLLPAQTIGAAR